MYKRYRKILMGYGGSLFLAPLCAIPLVSMDRPFEGLLVACLILAVSGGLTAWATLGLSGVHWFFVIRLRVVAFLMALFGVGGVGYALMRLWQG